MQGRFIVISAEITAAVLAEKCGIRLEDAETLARLTAAINNRLHRDLSKQWLTTELVRASSRRPPRQPRKQTVARTFSKPTFPIPDPPENT
jgi:hypothetical protein